MVSVLGLDIGGANTKGVFLSIYDHHFGQAKVLSKYFPIWRSGRSRLQTLLEGIKDDLIGSRGFDGVGVTMTAELSDAYWSKREGVNHILDCVEKVFTNMPIHVIDVDARLVSVEDARSKPLMVAAANWAATGWLVLGLFEDCIVIDVGSTSTSIIPVTNGAIATVGKTDLEKLLYGELVYTGSLRTNVVSIVDSVPYRGRTVPVSSEMFALSGDVHLILGNISGEDYTMETADGRGRSRRDALTRLARVVCADLEMLLEEEIVEMAEFIYSKQIDRIVEALNNVAGRTINVDRRDFTIVVTGLGRNFLAKTAAIKAGFSRIVDLEEFIGREASITTPAFGVALMVASMLLGKRIDVGSSH